MKVVEEIETVVKDVMYPSDHPDEQSPVLYGSIFPMKQTMEFDLIVRAEVRCFGQSEQ